ncbi:MAG: preprotein translocase subunit SecE [Candidatus Promineifilaceae bacterium]|jgi:preprotein translocase subunit SecE
MAVKDIFQSSRTFFHDVGTEMKKTTWPSRRELIQSTIAVIVCVVMLSVFIWISDKVLIGLIQRLV